MTVPMDLSTRMKLLSDRKYNFLKKMAIIILPLLGSLYFGLAQIWKFPHQEEISGTIVVLNTFVGAVVLAAKKVNEVTGAKYDGTLFIEEFEDHSTLRLTDVDPKTLDTKGEIVFKVTRSKV